MGFTKTGDLIVHGNIEAVSGFFGSSAANGWTINDNGIISGTTQNGMTLKGGEKPMIQMKKGGKPFFQFNGSQSHGFYFFIGADLDTYGRGTFTETLNNLNSNVGSYMGFADDGLFIKGNITATTISAVGATLGGWTIGATSLSSGQISLDAGSGKITAGSTTISSDGSISTGSGFSVNKDGEVKVAGEYVNLAG